MSPAKISSGPNIAKGLCALLVLGSLAFWLMNRMEPSTSYVRLSTLEDEANLIVPLQGDALVDSKSGHKASDALVLKTYKAVSQDSQIRSHYRDELQRNGWHQVPSLSSSVDEYCKGALGASLQLSSEVPTYSFGVSWHQHGTACKAKN
ncbi:hypothetical protein KW851_04865 [Pseudomonas sp. PDM33]|uniref:hypothetical protein n=1 Tax=Pseudomonas sp. PDM33 TaxID=2854765 RepID=UPI001C472DC7|nr:hypothetical protein [Pseudomonas sp. PDM33]MBV7582138.1 hypothetical protein [Pseudomonas sp. PDM33]